MEPAGFTKAASANYRDEEACAPFWHRAPPSRRFERQLSALASQARAGTPAVKLRNYRRAAFPMTRSRCRGNLRPDDPIFNCASWTALVGYQGFGMQICLTLERPGFDAPGIASLLSAEERIVT
jgi:hypothetical protein